MSINKITKTSENNNIQEETTEYKDLSYLLDPNSVNGEDVYYHVSDNEPIYKIDLNKRTVEVPEFLSLLEDHNAEVVWFQVDRFFDNVDLYHSNCWIQYINANKETYITKTTPRVLKSTNHNILYIPWPISGPATKAAGNVTFSFQFFQIDEEDGRVLFSIHTKPATGKILHGLHINPVEFILDGYGDEVKVDEDAEWEWWKDPSISPQQQDFYEKYMKLEDAVRKLSDKYNLLWMDYEHIN